MYVLTSRPLPARVPADVFASQGGPAGLLEQLRSARLEGDVHLLGGPRTLQAFHQLGAIDRLEILVLPILLGEGVPLFPLGTSQVPLRLEGQRAFSDGTSSSSTHRRKARHRVDPSSGQPYLGRQRPTKEFPLGRWRR